MNFAQTEDSFKAPIFSPRKGKTLVSPYTPTQNEIVALGADTTITVDTIAIVYVAGTYLGLEEGVTYTLSADTPVHYMD